MEYKGYLHSFSTPQLIHPEVSCASQDVQYYKLRRQEEESERRGILKVHAPAQSALIKSHQVLQNSLSQQRPSSGFASPGLTHFKRGKAQEFEQLVPQMALSPDMQPRRSLVNRHLRQGSRVVNHPFLQGRQSHDVQRANYQSVSQLEAARSSYFETKHKQKSSFFGGGLHLNRKATHNRCNSGSFGMPAQVHSARSSGDYSLMREVIGLRRSMQNIDYRITCLGCQDQAFGPARQACPQCEALESAHHQMAPQSQLPHPQQMPRSATSCNFQRISPMVEAHYSPRLEEYNLMHRQQLTRSQGQHLNGGLGSCQDITKLAHERANQARRSHRRYDRRVVGASESPSTSLQDRRLHSGRQPSRKGTSPASQAMGAFSFRLQPSQLVSQSHARLPQVDQVDEGGPDYVLVENERHQSCAIQQPCDHCNNTGCFAPINGSKACCFQLLEGQQHDQRAAKLDELEMRQAELDYAVALMDQHNADADNSVLLASPDRRAVPPDQEKFLTFAEPDLATVLSQPDESVFQSRKASKSQAIQTESEAKPARAVGVDQATEPAPIKTTQTKAQSVQTAPGRKKKVAAKKQAVSAAVQVSPRVDPESSRQVNKGSYELQKHIAMLNKLCVFHLNRATSRQQSAQATRKELERNRPLFDTCSIVLEQLKLAYSDTMPNILIDADPTDPKDRTTLSSQTQALDEDTLFSQVRVHTDPILVPHVALFKFYKVPRQLEGNLLLIMYLLNCTLDQIYERLREGVEETFELPKAQDYYGNRYGRVDGGEARIQASLIESFTRPESPPSEPEELVMVQSSDDIVAISPEPWHEEAIEKKVQRQVRSKPLTRTVDPSKFYERRKEPFIPAMTEPDPHEPLMTPVAEQIEIDSPSAAPSSSEQPMMPIGTEVCPTEFASIELADAQEIQIEKKKARHGILNKPVLAPFDYEAFYKRQGAYDTPQKQVQALVNEIALNRLTTEELSGDEGLADHLPIELTKKQPERMRTKPVPLKTVRQQPEPILIKEKVYELPVCEPFAAYGVENSHYVAIKLEEHEVKEEPVSVEKEEVRSVELIQDSPTLSSQQFSSIQDENLALSDEDLVGQEVRINKNFAHFSILVEDKIKLNDYVFDERLNLQDELSHFELKKMLEAKQTQIGELSRLIETPNEVRVASRRDKAASRQGIQIQVDSADGGFKRTRSHEKPPGSLTPQTIIRQMAQIDQNEENKHNLLSSRRYLDMKQVQMIDNVVNFVSPVNHLNAYQKEQLQEYQSLQEKRAKILLGSPVGLPSPAQEGSEPYVPYKSSKFDKPSKQMFHYSPKNKHRKRTKRDAETKQARVGIEISTGDRVSQERPQGTKTPQAVFGGIQFPKHAGDSSTTNANKAAMLVSPNAYQVDDSSAPTTKLHHEDAIGGLSERLEHNRDPLSMNRGIITIDDDGNINMASSPSRSPPPLRQMPKGLTETEEMEAPDEEARTFVSQHLLFSHLVSMDGKKNTLSMLNQAKHADMVNMAISLQARDVFPGAYSSRHMSPSASRQSGRGSAQMQIGSLQRLLNGGGRGSRKQSPGTGSFMSSFGAGLRPPSRSQYGVNNDSINQAERQFQRPSIVKKAAKVNNLSGQPGYNASSTAFFNDFQSPQIDGFKGQHLSHNVFDGNTMAVGGQRASMQHTFYANELQQVIPEQLNEESHRQTAALTTAKFRQESGSGVRLLEEAKSARLLGSGSAQRRFTRPVEKDESNKSPDLSNINIIEDDDQASIGIHSIESKLKRKSILSQDNLAKYLLQRPSNSSSQVTNSLTNAQSQLKGGFFKYLDKKTDSSVTGGVSGHRDSVTQNQLPQSQTSNLPEENQQQQQQQVQPTVVASLESVAQFDAMAQPTFSTNYKNQMQNSSQEQPVKAWGNAVIEKGVSVLEADQRQYNYYNTGLKRGQMMQSQSAQSMDHNLIGLPGAAHNLSSAMMRPHSSASMGLHHAGLKQGQNQGASGPASVYSQQQRRAGSVGDHSSMVSKRKMIEFKGPQTSNIMPVFRMQKAKPIPEASPRAELPDEIVLQEEYDNAGSSTTRGRGLIEVPFTSQGKPRARNSRNVVGVWRTDREVHIAEKKQLFSPLERIVDSPIMPLKLKVMQTAIDKQSEQPEEGDHSANLEILEIEDL